MVVNIVRVASEEIEPNYRNNVAAALVRVVGPFRPPAPTNVCRTLSASPPNLEDGRSSMVRLVARNRLGRPVSGLVVRARGAGVRLQARTDRQGVARMELIPGRVGLVFFASGPRLLRVRGRPSCVTVLGVQRARSTKVTG
jgi:hypothetical protein